MQRTLSSPQELQRFCEKGKHKIFQSYNGSHEAMDKLVTFIQQVDAAFMVEETTWNPQRYKWLICILQRPRVNGGSD